MENTNATAEIVETLPGQITAEQLLEAYGSASKDPRVKVARKPLKRLLDRHFPQIWEGLEDGAIPSSMAWARCPEGEEILKLARTILRYRGNAGIAWGVKPYEGAPLPPLKGNGKVKLICITDEGTLEERIFALPEASGRLQCWRADIFGEPETVSVHDARKSGLTVAGIPATDPCEGYELKHGAWGAIPAALSDPWGEGPAGTRGAGEAKADTAPAPDTASEIAAALASDTPARKRGKK
jgi:hypothetical protein